MVERFAERLGVNARDLFTEDAGDWFLRELFTVKLNREQWRTVVTIIKAVASERIWKERKLRSKELRGEATH